MLIRYFAGLVPLQVLVPPIDLPTYPEEACWQMLSSLDPAGRDAARSEVGRALRDFERGADGFAGPCELVVAVGTK